MPVLDHDVHEKVKVGSDFKYGCNNNKPRGKGYWVQEREYKTDGTYVLRDHFIKHQNTTACRSFALWDIDSACRNCPREKDVEYAAQMLALK